MADKKNREDLTEQDRAKNLKWAVIGQRGEKRVVKVQERENDREWRQQANRGGRGRGAWAGDRGKRMRQEEEMEEDMEEDMERPRTRTKQ